MSADDGGTRLRVLVILGHPRADSLCGALADAFCQGGAVAGVALRRIDLAALDFDLNVTRAAPCDQPAEPDLRAARAAVAWADHLVVVFPTWWGTMPALLKGFLDRLLLPGFAFADRDDGEGWEKLLRGKSAHLLTTMDTPGWVYRWIYKAPGLNGVARATFGFCGIAPVRRTVFGPVKGSGADRRERWIADARRQGAALAGGALSPGQRIRRQIAAWLAALRLQFYPMNWLAYVIGALGARRGGMPADRGAFWLGLACLFCVEAATVFANDYFDIDSDRANRHYGPFTGGARVLVDRRIAPRALGIGIAVALAGASAAGAALATFAGWPVVPFLLAFSLIAIFYTVPPLKLCWRGLGEIDVAVTHGFGAVLLGYLAQGGALDAPFPWLIGLPLFWAVLPAIILSGVPDYDADRGAGKYSLAAWLGPRAAVAIAELATAAAAIAAFAWVSAFGALGLAAAGLVVVPYAAMQIVVLDRFRSAGARPRRIDRLMVTTLSFILLFVGLPLWALLR